jgi:hypothetical protein
VHNSAISQCKVINNCSKTFILSLNFDVHSNDPILVYSVYHASQICYECARAIAITCTDSGSSTESVSIHATF